MFRSLYKGAVAAIADRAWAQAQALVATLVAAGAGGGVAAARKALAGVGKFLGHLPPAAPRPRPAAR